MNRIMTPHINADEGAFAKSILLPGDPHRSEFIAKEFMTDAHLVNDVRGVKGYTGKYKGKPISVMATGMGQPAMGIYSHELFSDCFVDNIIRVGSCGCYDPDLHLADIIIAQGACTNGAYQEHFLPFGVFSAISDYTLTENAVAVCRKNDYNFKVGNLLSSDVFYSYRQNWKDWQRMGCLGVEMESYMLYANAAFLRKRALCICSVSDSFVYPEEDMSADEREVSFTNMITVGLETGISMY